MSPIFNHAAYETLGREIRAMNARDELVIADMIRRGLIVPTEGGQWQKCLTETQPH